MANRNKAKVLLGYIPNYLVADAKSLSNGTNGDDL